MPTPPHPNHIKSKIVSHIVQWNSSHLYVGPGSNVGSSTDKWLSPPLGWFELIFSGSFNRSSNSAGIGGIIRDPFGIMFFAYPGKVTAAQPLEAELLLAFENGLEVCKEMQITTLQIEG